VDDKGNNLRGSVGEKRGWSRNSAAVRRQCRHNLWRQPIITIGGQVSPPSTGHFLFPASGPPAVRNLPHRLRWFSLLRSGPRAMIWCTRSLDEGRLPRRNRNRGRVFAINPRTGGRLYDLVKATATQVTAFVPQRTVVSMRRPATWETFFSLGSSAQVTVNTKVIVQFLHWDAQRSSVGQRGSDCGREVETTELGPWKRLGPTTHRRTRRPLPAMEGRSSSGSKTRDTGALVESV